MKKRLWIVLVILALIAAIPLLHSDKTQVLAETLEPGLAPNAVVAEPQRVPVIAEGAVLPVEYATLSLAASGIVAEVRVAEGDSVEAGDVILVLERAHQEAAVAQAQAALDSAWAQLAALQAGARAQEISVAQAGLEAAQARLGRLQEGARPKDLAAARASLEAAQATLDRLYEGPTEHQRIAAEANLANAEAQLKAAQAAYDPVSGRGDVAMLHQSLQLQQATNAYEAAKANYEALFAKPEANIVAQAQAQVKQGQATLERLLAPTTASEMAEAEAMVRQAEAQLELLKAGSREEEIAAAEASVAAAEAALAQALASLDDTELQAPFAGTVDALYPSEGELVGPGMPVAELADRSAWKIETDDLSELDVVRVNEGDSVVLTFDALDGLELPGTVERIKPIGTLRNGDITYTVVVRPQGQDDRLRWNMTAVATIP